MIFIYIFLIGFFLCKVVPGYEFENILLIINTGYSGIGKGNVFEMLISFTFYYISITMIIESIEQTIILYEFIHCRTSTKVFILHKMIRNMTETMVKIILQKLIATSLISLIEGKIYICLEYFLQDLIIITTLMLIGLLSILCFYNNIFSQRISVIIGMMTLIIIFSNVRNFPIADMIIPRTSVGNLYITVCLCIKILLFILLYLTCKRKSLKFERMNNND